MLKHTRILLALLVVLATVAVPTAGAAVDPDHRPGSTTPTVVLHRSAPPGYQGRVYRTHASPPSVRVSHSSPSAGSGIDWADAGIGAGAVLGAAMLVGGLLLATRRTGRVATP